MAFKAPNGTKPVDLASEPWPNDDLFGTGTGAASEAFGGSPDAFAAGGFGGAVLGNAAETISLADIDTSVKREPKKLAPGVYQGRVKDVTYGQSKNSRKWMFTFLFQVWDNEGTTVYVRDYKLLYEADKKTLVDVDQLARLKILVQKLAPDFDFAHFSPEAVATSCIGQLCRIKLRIGDPYQGQTRNEIAGDDGVLPAQQGFA